MALRRMRRARPAQAAVFLCSLFGARAGDAGIREWWFGQPWSFVQSVGGIRIGAATRMPDERVQLSVECDVSGARSITGAPHTMNSAIGVSKVLAAVDGRRIAISIRTGVGESSGCPPLVLSGLDPGAYVIVYSGADRELHELGKVEVP